MAYIVCYPKICLKKRLLKIGMRSLHGLAKPETRAKPEKKWVRDLGCRT